MSTIFSVDFGTVQNLETLFDGVTKPFPYGTNAKQVLGWGTFYAYALTCSETWLYKDLQSPFPSPLATSTTRGRVAIASVPSSVRHLWEWYEPNDDGSICSATASFSLDVANDGTLALIIRGPNGTNPTTYNSAAGVFLFDGTQNCLQVSFNFTTDHTVAFQVVRNNVVVTSNTWSHGTWTDCAGSPSPVTGFRSFNTFTDKPRPGNTAMFAWYDLAVENTVHITSYLPTIAYALTNSACTPIAPPVPTPTTYPIRRLRRFMLPWDDANRMKFLSRMEIILQAGIGTADIANPTVMLRLSKDGGKTWGHELQMQAGELGAYSTRVYANRLGRGRNWVAEVTVSDPVDWQLLQCLIDYEEGSS